MAFLGVALVGIGLTAASPLALDAIGGAVGYWERLSLIGQTYGAAGAFLSVLALVGVVVTLVFQAQENRRAREETRRQAMAGLLMMAIEDPDLDACWGPVPPDEDVRERRRQLYLNMIVSQWEMSFETRSLPEARLRPIAREMFEGAPGRRFWERAGKVRLETSDSRLTRRFHEILDEEYRRARLAVPPEPVPSEPGRSATPALRPAAVAGVLAGAAAAVGALAVVVRRLRGGAGRA
ncbi:DUF6082 family protein [Allonocardiopsis opalescens]|uniref:DUF6082 family protein n=1 Tax=Allonocardiopsis opalescens TaxID=1144618 RepID=UPI001B7FFCE1|nr:DUF6082 family protein [Allonocardiopsis opalescens]